MKSYTYEETTNEAYKQLLQITNPTGNTQNKQQWKIKVVYNHKKNIIIPLNSKRVAGRHSFRGEPTSLNEVLSHTVLFL